MTSSDAPVADVLPLRFEVPEQFTEIDLAEEPELRAERTLAQLAEYLPHSTDEQRLHLAMVQEVSISRMVAEGAVYAATLVAATEEDQPRLTTGQFTVTARRVPGGVHSHTLSEIAEQLRSDELRRDVGFVPLPAGRALAVVEDRELRTPVTVLGDASDDLHVIRQLQLTLPFPDGDRLAIFTVSTECLYDWESYVDIMGGIARTVEFTGLRQDYPAADEPLPSDVPTGEGLRRVLDGG